MTKPTDRLARNVLVASVAVASLAMLVGAVALLVRALGPERPPAPADRGGTLAVHDAKATAAATAPAAAAPRPPPSAGKRFTLRLGQGFRFKDGVVVANEPNERPDVVFKVILPQAGGAAWRYDGVTRQLEQKMDATLSSPAALLLATRVKAFADKPNLARTTSGDAAAFDERAPFFPGARYVLLQTAAGEHYLLTLDEMETASARYDEWRIGFAYERVELPVGLAGGKVNAPFPGKLVFRDWHRSKMIVRVDLTTGKEDVLADGTVPSTGGEGLVGFAEATGAFVVHDARGATLHTVRFDDLLMAPILSPDGSRLAGWAKRAGPRVPAGLVMIDGPPRTVVAVYDMAGREVAELDGYDEPAWTPDGKLVATGALTAPGLFEIDPATRAVRPIDAKVAYPQAPDVSPDGKTIAFVSGGKVWLIGRDGAGLRQLFPHGLVQQRPAFSPDGTKVAIVICNRLANEFSGEVHVIDVQTREATALRTSTGDALVPDPDSRINWVR